MILYIIGKNRNGIQFFEEDAECNGFSYVFTINVFGEEHKISIDKFMFETFMKDFSVFDYAVVSEKSLEEAKKIWNKSLNKLVEQHMREVHKYESLFIRSDEEFLDKLEKAMGKMSSEKMKKVKDIVNKATNNLEP